MPDVSAIRFAGGGSPAVPPPEVFERARASHPLWMRLLESAYEKLATSPESEGRYADPKGQGATVVQVWRFLALFGREPWAVVAHELPPEQTEGITRLVQSSPARVVQILKAMQALQDHVNAVTLHFDGQTGHCIRITSHDTIRDRFTYHDPWPERSLLCKENNLAGVDAQPEGSRWSVSAQELQRVIVASFIDPAVWARLQGQQVDLDYEAWKQGDFFRFFHLKPLDEVYENGVRRNTFAPGPFRKEIAIGVFSVETGRIVQADLLADTHWMASHLAMGIDLARSFVLAFAPPPDGARFEPIARALQRLAEPAYAREIAATDPATSELAGCLQAFMGRGQCLLGGDFASLRIETSIREGRRQLQMEYVLH
jgi:hypothetical protein